MENEMTLKIRDEKAVVATALVVDLTEDGDNPHSIGILSLTRKKLRLESPHVREFTAALKTFTARPDMTMGDSLFELLSCAQQHLSEQEFEKGLSDIDDLVRSYEARQTVSETVVLDESSKRLMTVLMQGMKDSGLLRPYLRSWIDALCQGDAKKVAFYGDSLKALIQIPEGENLSLQNIADLKCSGVTNNFLRATPTQLDLLATTFNHASSSAGGLLLTDAFECQLRQVDRDSKAFQTAGQPSRLLCHCSRQAASVGTIMREGLQIKGRSGRLGAGIYLSDCVEKCISYSAHSMVGEEAYGVVLVVETVLGKVYETRKDGGCPPGFDSVFAIGKIQTTDPREIEFCDGGKSIINAGQQRDISVNNHTAFQHNEYAVYDPQRVRVGFILIFRKPVAMRGGAYSIGGIASRPVVQMQKVMNPLLAASSSTIGVASPSSQIGTRSHRSHDYGSTSTENLFRAHQEWSRRLAMVTTRLTNLRRSKDLDSQQHIDNLTKLIETLRDPAVSSTLIQLYIDTDG